MLGTRLAKTALCFTYSKNLKFYGKRLQQRFYSSKVIYVKIYPDIMIKTLRLQHWVNIGDFIPKFENVFVLTLETTTPNNLIKFRKFSREISAVEFCYS